MQISALYPEQPREIGAIDPFAEVVSTTSLSRLWMGQSFVIDSHSTLAALGRTPWAVPVGIGTALAVLRSPYDAAMQARSVAIATGNSVSIAYGSADPAFVSSVRGRPFSKPATYMSTYVRIVRDLLSGVHVRDDLEGEIVGGVLPPAEHPRVEIGIGVLREGMARVGAPSAEFQVSWLAPKNYIRDVLNPASTRSDGTHPRTVAYVQCAVDRPGRSGTLLAHTGAGKHLETHHYTEMLRRAGLDVDASDPASGARELMEKRVFVFDTADRIAEELLSYSECGVDEVIVNVTGVSLLYGASAAIEDLADIVAAADRVTPGS